MRILITGGAGMIGSHAAEYYAKNGNDVIVLDNLMRSSLFGCEKESVEYNWNYLKKIKRSGLLPAGVVFVGGSANILGLEELSKSILKLGASGGTTEIFGNSKTKLRDSSWFTALGLVISGRDNNGYSEGSFRNLFKDLKNTIKSSIKQLMP